MSVTASDNGVPQTLESTVSLTVTVKDHTNGANSLTVEWMTETSSPVIPEDLTLGIVVARITVLEDHGEGTHLNLQSQSALCLKQTDSSLIYLMMVCDELDREITPEYYLTLALVAKNGKIIFEHPIHIEVGDVNDNPPAWSQSTFYFTFNRSDDDHQQALKRLIAVDLDIGDNGKLRYSLDGTDSFTINPETGLISAITKVRTSIEVYVIAL